MTLQRVGAVAQAMALLLLLRLALRVRRYDWVIGRVAALRARAGASADPAAIISAVSAAEARLGPQSCLVSSLCLVYLLRRGGRPAVLVLGAAPVTAGRPLFHAWVEVEGEVLTVDHDAKRCARLAAFG